MKRLFFPVILLLSFCDLFSQPIINKNDMPIAGDTIRLSITNDDNDIDYTLTGADYIWNFSSLTEEEQRVDTFVSVSSTPLLYQAEFNNPFDTTYRASYAQPQPDINQLPNVEFTEIFYFFRASDYTYTQVGQGAKINSIPTPIKYNDPDLLYTFPLTYSVTDSSEYEYHLSIPNLGYYGESKKRVSIVDGWGTLITPYDTFPAIRVMSTIYIHDSIYMDTIGYGFAQDRTEIEYKWLTDTIGLPALKITKRLGGMGGGNVSLEDRYKYIPSGVSTYEFPYTLTFFSLFPNPADASSKIFFALANPSSVNIEISDITGKGFISIEKEFPKGFSSFDIGTSLEFLPNGLYLATIRAGSNSKTIKFTIQ